MTEFLTNGQGSGDIGARLADCGFDTGLMRPYWQDLGSGMVELVDKETGRMVANEDGKMVKETKPMLLRDAPGSAIRNATSLRKDEWIKLDEVVTLAARAPLQAYADIALANMDTIDGMSTTVYQWETQSDPGEAVVDMDGLSEGRNDAPLYQLESMPIAITHDDFFFSQRVLNTSRNMGQSLDVSRGEAAGRRVGETIEKTTIGTQTGMRFGVTPTGSSLTSTVYGYINYPNRVTKTDMTAPTGTNGDAILKDWLAVIELLRAVKRYGPFVVYTSTPWDTPLDSNFSSTEPSAGSLRDRLMKVKDITDIRRLDFFPEVTSGTTSGSYDLIFVQMTSDVVRAINGMDLRTIQWDQKGGMQKNFKVMAMQAANIRSDYNGSCGIAQASSVAVDA